MGRSFGVASIILGIISLPYNMVMAIMHYYDTPIFFIVGLIMPFLAIFLGIFGILMDDSKGMAIAGVIFGIIVLVSGFSTQTIVSASVP
ncbi:MAG: hypothetical protein ACFE8B_04970 [Candidatus Hermodarchaeota archaeon]